MKSNAFELHNYAAVLTPNPHIGSSSNASNCLTMKTTASTSNVRRSEKYSLRQRQKRRNARTQQEEEEEPENEQQQPQSAMHFGAVHDFGETKCTKAIHMTGTHGSSKASGQGAVSRKTKSAAATKAKTKPAPLSKYRRKTANARERTRMREINSAFENLRHCVPHPISGDDPSNTNEKLTKITTLRLAMRYIELLNDALTNPGFETEFLLECLRDSSDRQQSDSRNSTTLPMAGVEYAASLPAIKTKATQSPPAKASKANAKAKPTKKGTTASAGKKRQGKKQKMQTAQRVIPQAFNSPESAYSSSGIASPACSSSSSAYASLSANSTPDIAAAAYSTSSVSLSSTSSSSAASPLYNAATNLLDTNALELNALLLESDGDSLHLSEHCLSPLQSSMPVSRHLNARSYASDLLSSAMPQQQLSISTDLPISCPVMEQPDVELSLRLLDSNVHAFDFASEPQQPSDCISPLATLDSFNPFGDLLHADFSEHSTLDLFLT